MHSLESIERPPPAAMGRRAGGRTTSLMRQVNISMRTLSMTADASDLIAFLCECGLEGCFRPLKMTGSEFDAAAGTPDRWILAPGHEAPTTAATGVES
jgi:hypothetical protein